ncbi:MAG: RNA polymerase sigma factor (sigma-70 family) [Planctomycetota bacterium]|jgi:RNA polymerase sigma factor (sigma-70 family)
MKALPTRIHSVQALSPDLLAEHTDWMKRLVRYIVRDHAQVDDLVQDAWAAAMNNPPPVGLPLRAWLAGIVRRTAQAAGRGDARRRQREEDRALRIERSGQGHAPSVAELSACADEQRFLLEVLGELPEGEKAVLLLRFYEDLPPREIALRLGVPVNTVRTRQRLGIERVRERLDRRHDGNASAWATALLPIVGVSGRGLRAAGGLTASMTAGVAVGEAVGIGLAAILRYLALGLGALAAVGVAWWWWPNQEAPDLSRKSTPEVALAAVFGVQDDRALEGVAAPRPSMPTALRTAASETAPPALRFLGLVVDESNQPIADARLLERSEPRPNVTYVHGGWPDWMPAWRRSGADGTFSVDATATDEELFVAAVHPDYAHIVEVTKMVPGEETRISMVRTSTTTLEVELFNESDGKRAMNFAVLSYQSQDPFAEGCVRQSILNETATTASGILRLKKRFAVDRPLKVHLMEAPGFGFFPDPIYSLTIEVVPVENGTTHVRMERSLDAPEASGQYPMAQGIIVDEESGEPIPGAMLRTMVELANGELDKKGLPVHRHRYVASDANGRFSIALPKGSAEAAVRVTHPHRVPEEATVSADPLSSGEIRLRLRGSLSGQVLDGEGRPVPGAPLLVHVPTDRQGGARTDSERMLADQQGRFELPDLFAGRVSIFVLRKPRDADENALTSESFRVKGGMNREVTVRIDRPERVHVTGNILHGGVLLRHHVPIFLPMTDDGGWTMAKAGKYGFDAGGLERGRYLVALVPEDDRDTRGPTALLPEIAVTGLGAQRFSFQVPAAELTGRIVLAVPPSGAATSGFRVLAVPMNLSGFAADLLGSAKAADSFGVSVDPADGTFKLPHLSSGRHRLELWSADGAYSNGPVAVREVEVAGSAHIGDWTL